MKGMNPLAIEDVLQAPSLAAFSPASFSADNRLLAYVVTDNRRRRKAVEREELLKAGVGWFGVASDIWITDLQSGDHRNLTESQGNSWGPVWSLDGSRLAFLSDRQAAPKVGPARLWIWEHSSDELRVVESADVRECLSGIHWARDRDSVLVSLFPAKEGRDGFADLMRGRSSDALKSGTTVKVFSFDPSEEEATPMTDQINLTVWRQDLGLVNINTGKVEPLKSGERIAHYLVSPDRTKVAFSVIGSASQPGSGRYYFDILVQDLESGDEQVVASQIFLPLFGNTFSWSPSGDMISWRTGGPGVDDEVCVVDLNDKKQLKVAEKHEADDHLTEIEPPVWDSDGTNVFFVRDGSLWKARVDGSGASILAKSSERRFRIVSPRQGHLFTSDDKTTAVVFTTDPETKKLGLARVDLETGEETQIFEEDKRYGGYGSEPTISPDGGAVVYIAEDPTHPADFYLREGDLTEARRVSEVAEKLVDLPLGKSEVIEWYGIDGGKHRGALIYPSAYDPGTKYPLIVRVYGGSEISHYLNAFGYANAPIENLHLFTTRGYAILLADSTLQVGTPMLDLMKTVMPGVDKAVEMEVADPERIAVTGHSYGGYSTLALIVQSKRFKAAVMRAGMGDMISQYGQLAPDGTNYGLAWAESGQGRMGGSPWEHRYRYLENSPFFYLDRVETPLLIIHGSKDDAVPVYLADQVFTGLRRLGKPVTYLRYEGENHWEGGWDYENQVDVIRRTIDWLDKYLLPQG
jgi:dipeptidyl aminopeptidase/acylaminoacyl peptidase